MLIGCESVVSRCLWRHSALWLSVIGWLVGTVFRYWSSRLLTRVKSVSMVMPWTVDLWPFNVHTSLWTVLTLDLVCLSVCLSLCLSVCVCLSVCLSMWIMLLCCVDWNAWESEICLLYNWWKFYVWKLWWWDLIGMDSIEAHKGFGALQPQFWR